MGPRRAGRADPRARGRRRVLVAFDVGGSKVAVVAREVRARRDAHADKVRTPRGGVRAFLRLVDAQLERVPGGRDAVAAIGVAVARIVDAAGTVLQAGNLRGWADVPLRALLERRYGVPVFVEGDARCGALGERWLGAAAGMDDFAFLSLGTGVGAGLFLGGRLHRGAHSAAGEAGDLTFSGATAGARLSKRQIKDAAERATGQRMSSADALARAARDRRLERATRPTFASLVDVVVAIAALLDPEAVVVGGGTSAAGEALLRRVRRSVPRQLRRTRVLLAGLGPRSPVYGALWGAREAWTRASPRTSRGG